MAEVIKCNCTHCGAKYRLPVEYQGRTARCKKCGEKFQVPREKNLEDSVLDWLNEGEEEQQDAGVMDKPRVISFTPKDKKADDSGAPNAKGPIRMKSTTEKSDES